MEQVFYGMAGGFKAQPGTRRQLIEILLNAAGLVSNLDGCRAYIVAEDSSDDDAITVFEIWDDKESHDASLQNEQVRALIGQAMPLIAGAPNGKELRISGGFGIDLK